jgi:hypothetical protein
MADFMPQNPNTAEDMNSILGMYKTSYDAADAIRQNERKKKFEKSFASLINNAGNLSQAEFYKQAREGEFSPEQIREAMKYREDQLGMQNKTAQADLTQRALGYDPLSGGRNNAQIGNTPEGIIPGQVKTASPSMDGAGAPIGPTTIDADKLPNPANVGPRAPEEQPAVQEAPVVAPAAQNTSAKLDTWFNSLKGMSKQEVKKVQAEVGLTGKDLDGRPGKLTKQALAAYLKKQAPIDEATTTGGTFNVQAPDAGFVSKGEEAKMAPDNVGPDVFAPAPEDTRTFDQKFQDSYNKDNSLAGQVQAGSANAGAAGLFDWQPKDTGTNEFRQYRSALDSMLKSNGFADAGSYLKQIYDQELRANTPPMPNQGLLVTGVDGVAKYQGELNNYIAGLAKAKGAAEAKVMQARDGLAQFANKYGVDTQTSEKFGADMGGRRAGAVSGAGVMRTRAVSDAEKAIGDRTGAAYQDIAAARDQFKSATDPEAQYSAVMSAINASLKADGASMNADNVVAFLVSSGMVPPVRAQAIKQLMSENPGGAMDAVTRLVKTSLAEGNPAQASKWFDQRINNVRGQLKLVGYDVIDGATNDAPAESGAKRALKAKAKGAPKSNDRSGGRKL